MYLSETVRGSLGVFRCYPTDCWCGRGQRAPTQIAQLRLEHSPLLKPECGKSSEAPLKMECLSPSAWPHPGGPRTRINCNRTCSGVQCRTRLYGCLFWKTFQIHEYRNINFDGESIQQHHKAITHSEIEKENKNKRQVTLPVRPVSGPRRS